MKWIDALNRKLGRFHVPFVTEAIIAGQVVFFGLAYSDPQVIGDMAFVWNQATVGGEWWRFVTFLFIPFSQSPLWAIFAWYLFYLFGTALDNHWGTFRYNIYMLIAYVATIGITWIVPDQAIVSSFIYTSVFLAFAFLYPDFELLIFFILPVKVKWLSLIAWAIIGVSVIFGQLPAQLAAGASVLNFLVFFAGDLINMLRTGQRRMKRQAQSFAERGKAFHTCVVCGKTDKSDPEEEFRYASGPDGPLCFCSEHFADHERHIAQMAARGRKPGKTAKEKW